MGAMSLIVENRMSVVSEMITKLSGSAWFPHTVPSGLSQSLPGILKTQLNFGLIRPEELLAENRSHSSRINLWRKFGGRHFDLP